MNHETVLGARGVALSYAGPPRVEALRGVDLTVRRGEFVAIVGTSGAGKSSLLNILGLLTSPSAGEVRVGDHAVRPQAAHSAGSADRERTRWRGHSLGFVFQAFHLLEDRTTVENVVLPLRYRRIPTREAIARAREVLRTVGLGHRLHATARTLSGGERQRVAIARALVTEPEVLLCDEPTGNLDTVNSAAVMSLLDSLHQAGHTIVVITHDEAVAACAERIVRLSDGRVVDDGGTDPVDGTDAVDPPCVARHALPPAPPGTLDSGDARTVPPARGGRLGLIGMLDEALGSLFASPSRTVLTCLGTVLGVATLVAVLGIASTVTGQVSASFDRYEATTVTATSDNPRASDQARLATAAGLNGSRGMGLYWSVDGAEVEADWAHADAISPGSIPVVAATASTWPVIGPTLRWGRYFDDSLANQQVVVLGAGAAFQLGISGPLGTESVLINGVPYLVIGVFGDVQRQPDLLASAIIPSRTAIARFGAPSVGRNTTYILDAEPGAANQIADELPYALSPENPAQIQVVPPPDPHQLQDSVAHDLSGLFAILAAVTLIIGMVGIANTSYVSVMERLGEIGLRRALGAQRSAIRRQFVVEALLVGAIGGVVGTFVGLVVVIAACLAKDWTAVVAPRTLILAPVAGLVCGAIAGLFPARAAARVDPAEALRQ